MATSGESDLSVGACVAGFKQVTSDRVDNDEIINVVVDLREVGTVALAAGANTVSCVVGQQYLSSLTSKH